MHYGNMEVIENEGDHFKFKIEDKMLTINKIKL